MIYPNDFESIITELKNGIQNSDLYKQYGFNMYVGIKARKNKQTKKIDMIIVTWNKEKSIYNNKIDVVNGLLTYIGSGLEGKQKVGRQNSTLIKYFNNQWDIPVVFCLKVKKTIKYISLLSQSDLGFSKPNKENRGFVFHFRMSEINHKNLFLLESIPSNQKIPWKETDKSIKERKKRTIFKVIKDQEMRELFKELQFIGDIGELVVMEYEYNRLVSLGLSKYAELIEHTSIEKGHGYGYDIKSYDLNKTSNEIEEIYIEVKTTKLDRHNSFFMSKNEFDFMNKFKSQYKIYRVYEIYDKEDTINIYDYPFNSLQFVEVENKIYKVKTV